MPTSDPRALDFALSGFDVRALARRVLRLAAIDDIERELLTAIGKLGKMSRMTGGVTS